MLQKLQQKHIVWPTTVVKLFYLENKKEELHSISYSCNTYSRLHCWIKWDDFASGVTADLNHVDVPDIHVYDNHDLASPDSDQLHLPAAPDAPRNAGMYLITLQLTILMC